MFFLIIGFSHINIALTTGSLFFHFLPLLGFDRFGTVAQEEVAQIASGPLPHRWNLGGGGPDGIKGEMAQMEVA